MRLNQLVDVDDYRIINELVLNSQKKSVNGMFFCLEGLTVDAHDFIDEAVSNGCVAVVHSKDVKKIKGIIYIRVTDVMATLHSVTSKFYDYPSNKLYVYGITGTNGKSTVMKTVGNILTRFGVKSGYVGTIAIEYSDNVLEPSLTTPDIVELQSHLNDMVHDGIEEVCLEVSSQGLALHRVDSIDFDSVSFTNLSHDHLDYHNTMENYFEAKKILFDRLKPEGVMIINADDEYGQKLIHHGYSQHITTYGIHSEADYQAKDIQLYDSYSRFILQHGGRDYQVLSNFVAEFNIYNVLNVIAILHQRGYELERIISELKDIDHVDGRQTMIDEGQDFKVIVDFGHSPDSMEKIYDFVRQITPKNNKIITVFGAAGARDKEKRPVMGNISSTMADYVILTEHDNRNERVDAITQDIISGISGQNYEFIPLRYDAIEKALSMAQAGDSVVIIGKGEEKFIYRSFGKEDWMGDDVAAREILIKHYGGK